MSWLDRKSTHRLIRAGQQEFTTVYMSAVIRPAEVEGFHAAQRGASSANPYGRYTTDHMYWARGYRCFFTWTRAGSKFSRGDH